MFVKGAVVLALLCIVLCPQSALACVDVTFLDGPLAARYNTSLPNGSPVYSNPLVGVYRWQDTTGEYIYEALCIDLETDGNGDPINFECVELTDARDETLTSGKLSSFRAQLLELLWGQFKSLVISTDNSVAFHLAIYEIVYDGDSLVFDANGFLVPGQDLTGGEFDGSDGGSTQWAIAESWLYALDLNGSSTDLIAWHSEDYQDQIVEEHFHPVPVEETTWGHIKSLYK